MSQRTSPGARLRYVWAMRSLQFAAVIVALVAGPGVAWSQQVIVDEPTDGLTLPTTPLAGDADARAVVANPAGLAFVEGRDLMLAAEYSDPEVADGVGPGIGMYAADGFGGDLIPRIGVGVGVEWKRPELGRFAPEPGTPVRLTMAAAIGFGRGGAIGLAWHHYLGDSNGGIGGLDTADVGLSFRLANQLAVGGGVRDLARPTVVGERVQRRYELEIAVRPTGTRTLELGFGARIGEDTGNVDAWARLAARVARGVTLHAGVSSQSLRVATLSLTGRTELTEREVRATLGLELSFGRGSVAVYGTGLRSADGKSGMVRGTVLARLASRSTASIMGEPDRIERLALSGELDARRATTVAMRLRAITADSHVTAVVISIDSLEAGWATLNEVRSELMRVRAAGKRVYAYLVAASGRDYFVATAADTIFVDPAGGVRLVGFASTTMYFRGALEYVGANAQFDKIAEYKSAPESYTQTGPSEPAARMKRELFDGLNDEFVGVIAEARGLTVAAVKALIEGGPYSATQLKTDKRLVDEVLTPEEIGEHVAAEVGLAVVGAAPVRQADRFRRRSIAVIYADGDIVGGESRDVPVVGTKLVGAQSVVSAIAAARADKNVAAIVLRIDSPGGSALASDVMSREVFATRGVKPIVCSMGDLAASGGYYLAAGCDAVYADAMTITGSIGIFSGKVDLSGTLEKLGIAVATEKRGDRADMESFYRPYTDEERVVINQQLRYSYDRFVDAVVRGRGLTAQAVDAVARGHVWTGKQALERGLVDKLGGLADAMADARARAGVAKGEPLELLQLPKLPRGLLGLVQAGLGMTSKVDSGSLLLGMPSLRALMGALPVSLLMEPNQAQARMPFDMVWQ